MTNRIDKRQLALAAALLVGVALLLVIWFARGKQANATAYSNIPARGMAGLQRASTHLANTPAVLKTFPADMVPAAATAHLLTSVGDVTIYAWPHGAKACGQRGLNLQPCGRLISEGGIPLIEASLPPLGRSSRGIEPSRPHVYGCWGS